MRRRVVEMSGMLRRRWVLWMAVVVVLGGCGSGGASPGAEELDQLRQQARDALVRYDKAVLDAGGRQGFVPVGDLTGQRGEWEPANGNNKQALLSGRVRAGTALGAAPHPTGTVSWDNGATRVVPMISAYQALARLVAAGTGDCPECVPLDVIGARLTTMHIRTTRGPATVPAWEYTLKGSAVRVTRVAVTSSAAVKVTPPSWDPFNPPGGLGIESATTTTSGRQLTVTFTGAPKPADQPCGVDYSTEAVESSTAVVVIVIMHPHAANGICTAIGASRTATVELAQPLGERAVLEVRQGIPVELTISG
jgi:hypothetical protein